MQAQNGSGEPREFAVEFQRRQLVQIHVASHETHRQLLAVGACREARGRASFVAFATQVDFHVEDGILHVRRVVLLQKTVRRKAGWRRRVDAHRRQDE